VSTIQVALGKGDGTLQSAGGSSETLPNLAINLQVGGATVAQDLNGDGNSSGPPSSSGGSSSSGGGSTGTPAGTYTVTITATGGSTVQTASYALKVS
jgi:hypothetical protein